MTKHINVSISNTSVIGSDCLKIFILKQSAIRKNNCFLFTMQSSNYCFVSYFLIFSAWETLDMEHLYPTCILTLSIELSDQGRVTIADWLPSGNQVVTASKQRTANLYNVETGDIINTRLNRFVRVFNTTALNRFGILFSPMASDWVGGWAVGRWVYRTKSQEI